MANILIQYKDLKTTRNTNAHLFGPLQVRYLRSFHFVMIIEQIELVAT